VASGSAATAYAILNITNAGDEIVSAQTLYGGTHNLFAVTLPKYGIKTRFVDPDNPDNFRKVITPKTKTIFLETIGNPATNLIDIKAVAAIAHKNGIPLIVDNTFGTPYLIRPFEHGADIIVHSATKYIGGHGNSIGGLIVDSGKFDWSASGNFPGFTAIDPGYGFSFWERFGNWEGKFNIAFVVKARLQLLRDFGACLSPQNAFLLLQGLESLSLRVQKHVANAQKIALHLSKHPLVSRVDYPGLRNNPYNALAKRYFPKGVGSVFSFHIKGGQKAARIFIENLKIFSHLANVGDAKSLVVHPATLTHSQLNEEQQRKAGINPDVVRLSIGIEDPNDLIWDINQALKHVAKG
jgi:O-acetylhomoserine (thiol)-lyase